MAKGLDLLRWRGDIVSNNVLVLYPGNWLYNASVIGFLEILSFGMGKRRIEEWLKEDGSVSIEKDIFKNVKKGKVEIPYALVCYVEFLTEGEDLQEWLEQKDKKGKSNKEKVKEYYDDMGEFGYKFVRALNKLFSSNMPYQNLVQQNDRRKFIEYVSKLSIIGEDRVNKRCEICGANRVVEPENDNSLEKRLFRFDKMHSSDFGPSMVVPNSFWNYNTSLLVCPLCAYLIIHHHKALTRLEDNSEIFINAPSFKVMWYLNKYLQTVYEKGKIATTKELLGMSIIEMALKVNVQLGKWNMMNIEIVTKSNGKVDFFSMPYEITVLLSNREVASLLNEIGELKVLNLILNSDFIKVLELAERIFKIALKPEKERSDQDKKFVSENIKLKRNIENLTSLSYKLFKLYAMIEEKAKKEAFV